VVAEHKKSQGVEIRESIRRQAMCLGFERCGFTSPAPSEHAAFYRQWIADGRHGEMAWLARDPERRADPRRVAPGSRSLIAVGLNYWQETPPGRARVARYALGEDYHVVLGEKLDALARWIGERFGAEAKSYVDTGPLLERPLAQRAGIGWQGKSTMIIDEKLGPWMFIGELLTNLELPPDEPAQDRCGSCVRCIAACPTGAITAPYQMDARRCISYLTIEHKGSIPEELRPLIGNHLYGCDECLDVCPWNRFAQKARETRFAAPADPRTWDLHELLNLSRQEFNRRFRHRPIARVKWRGLLRNACVVLGNIGTAADLPALERALTHEEALVREHAAWAAAQIRKRLDCQIAP
jgi:epoxyqueuosine reductase